MASVGQSCRWVVALVLSAGVSACILQLDDSIACGDGYVDYGAGEECDPLVPGSYEGACAETGRPRGTAACDLATCRIINDAEQCAICGDGVVDHHLGEECDGDNKDGATCALGGELQCDACRFDESACNKCGDGNVDPGEECDVGSPGDVVGEKSCEGLPYLVKPYASGTVNQCKDGCTWLRTGCGYCGDGVLDAPTAVDPDVGHVLSPPEICDGNEADPATLEQHCKSVCASNLRLECSFLCLDDCSGFDPQAVALPDPACCRKAGEPCPLPGADFPCCYAVDHPEDPNEGCILDLNNSSVCR